MLAGLHQELWVWLTDFLGPSDAKSVLETCKYLNNLLYLRTIDRLANKADTLLKWYPDLWSSWSMATSMSYSQFLELTNTHMAVIFSPFYKRNDLDKAFIDCMLTHSEEAKSLSLGTPLLTTHIKKYMRKIKAPYLSLLKLCVLFHRNKEVIQCNPFMIGGLMKMETNLRLCYIKRNPSVPAEYLLERGRQGQFPMDKIWGCSSIKIEHIRPYLKELNVQSLKMVLTKEGLTDSDLDVVFSNKHLFINSVSVDIKDCSFLSPPYVKELFTGAYGNLHKCYRYPNVPLELVINDMRKRPWRQCNRCLLVKRVLTLSEIESLLSVLPLCKMNGVEGFWKLVSLNPSVNYRLIKANLHHPWDLISIGMNPSITLSETLDYMKVRGYDH